MVKIDEKELKELFRDIKDNNKTAFEELYNKYNRLVYGIAFSILKNRQDSEDVVQTVFSKIYTVSKDKLPINKEATWLYSITKNEAITFLRKRKSDLNLDTIYEIEDNNDAINNIVEQDKFNRLISKLNDKEKEIVSLKIVSNLSFDEIGKLLNEPTGTIKWRYYKSIHNLKILLGNLAMFIFTFIIGIKTIASNKKSNKLEQIVEDNVITEQESVLQEAEKLEQDKSWNDELLNEDMSYSDNKEEIIQPEEPAEVDINYTGIAILSLSIIFLLTTIIFFIKSQPKRKTKTSK